MNAEEEKTFRSINPTEEFRKFRETVNTKNKYFPISTGNAEIDAALNGGFMRQTVTILHGAPAIGKTAFCQQIAEEIAAHGTPVYYLNLEMNSDVLYARSVSRIARQQGHHVTPVEVLRKSDMDEKTQNDIEAAEDEYERTIARRITYNPQKSRSLEGIQEDLEKRLENWKERSESTGVPFPVVFIDYLQLIDTGKNEAAESTKKALELLDNIKKNYDTAVIAISASNRASNKLGTVELESGRDTSALEYSGDLILGLSYTALEDGRKIEGKTDEYTLETIRSLRRTAADSGNIVPEVCNEISLKILKDRFGQPDRRLKLYFDAAHSRFMTWNQHAEERKDPEKNGIVFPPEYEQARITERRTQVSYDEDGTPIS